MDVTPKQISMMLARDAERVASMLLPGGKRSNGEWCAGSVSGDEGKSLKVALKGEDAGRWADFATSSGSGYDQSGDLLDLWCATRGLSLGETLKEARAYLNIPEPEFTNKPKQFEPPAVPSCSAPGGDVLTWLTDERKLSVAALKAYKIASGARRVVFPFLDPKGERVMVKTRSIDEKKIQPTSSNQKPILFGWQAIPDNARTVAICEGELDALSLWDYGYPAMSVPFGGGGGNKQAWIEHELENLSRFDDVYLVMDDDSAGKEAVVEIVKRLGSHRCRVVTLPRKDANDCLQQGVPKAEIVSAFNRAKTLDPEGLKNALGYLELAKARMFADPNAPSNDLYLPWQKTRDLVRLRQNELVVVFGINGHGKTKIVNQCALSTIRQGERAFVASMEYTPAIWLDETIMQATGITGGKPTEPYYDAIGNWMGDRLWLWGHTGTAKADRILEVMEYAYRRYRNRLFVVDSLLKCGFAEDDYNGQKAFIERLCDFKNTYPVTVVLVCHARKQRDENEMVGKMDVRGTGAITDLADTVLAVSRNKIKEIAMAKAKASGQPVDPQVAEKPDTWVTCSKQRLSGWEGAIGLWFDPNCKQFTGSPSERPLRYVDFSAANTAVGGQS